MAVFLTKKEIVSFYPLVTEGIQFGGHFPFPNDTEGTLCTRFNECDDE